MTMRRPREEELTQEVRELTDLLRNDASFADLRTALGAKGLSAAETILAGLIVGEDESQYGVFVTANQECVRFESAPNGWLTRWELIDHPAALTADFPAVSVGIAMKRGGDIA